MGRIHKELMTTDDSFTATHTKTLFAFFLGDNESFSLLQIKVESLQLIGSTFGTLLSSQHHECFH